MSLIKRKNSREKGAYFAGKMNLVVDTLHLWHRAMSLAMFISQICSVYAILFFFYIHLAFIEWLVMNKWYPIFYCHCDMVICPWLDGTIFSSIFQPLRVNGQKTVLLFTKWSGEKRWISANAVTSQGFLPLQFRSSSIVIHFGLFQKLVLDPSPLGKLGNCNHHPSLKTLE